MAPTDVAPSTCIILTIFGCLPLVAIAEDGSTKFLPENSVPTIGLLKILLALAFVIALFFVCVWILRKLGQLKPQSDKVIQVLGATSVGAKERLVLGQVGEEQILIGVSPGRVEKLHVITQRIEVEGNNPVQNLGFMSHFQTAMKTKDASHAS